MQRFYEFGPFRIDAVRHVLLRDGVPVPLKPKALETLLVLLQNHGRVVTKDELLRVLWPDTFVEEGNLTQHISLVRKALGETPQERLYIVTVPGQGYRFVADVTELSAAADEAPQGRIDSQSGSPDKSDAERLQGHDPSKARPYQSAMPLALAPAVPRVRNQGGVLKAVVISVVLVTAVGALLYHREGSRHKLATSEMPLNILAILPFKPLDAQSRDAQLELGMADALITRLGNVRQLTVRPTSAVLKFEGAGDDDPVACGRLLRVDAVLDGKIQKSGERLRVTVQLMRVADGASIWADTFDSSFGDIFSVQDTISVQVARALTLELTGAEMGHLVKRYTTNPEAYQAYLKGRYLWGKRSPESVEKAREFFQKALDMDPMYAAAYAGLADCFILPVTPGTSPRESYERAKAFALKALEIDETLADAHASLAFSMWRRDWDWATAEQEFRRSINLNPRYATARHWYGLMLGSMGRFDEALKELNYAQEIDPLSLAISTDLGAVLVYARRSDQAIEQLGKVIELDENFIPAHTNLAFAYASKAMFDEAAAEARKLMEISGSGMIGHSILAYVCAATGEKERAASILSHLGNRQRFGLAGTLAATYWSLGERDRAFAHLEEGLEYREWWLSALKVNPIFDGLRADPRYYSLLRRTGLPG